MARRPFINSRPVVRLAVLLWIMGGALLVANSALFWSYLGGSANRQSELDRILDAVGEDRRAISALEDELKRSKLEQLNRQVEFLNHRIAERTFGWSRLFDRLTEVLPWDVQLRSLSPLNIVPAKVSRELQAKREAETAGRFTLSIAGVAQRDDALLRFIDGLFQHPAFRNPNLAREARDPAGQLRFDLTVLYLPQAPDLTPQEASEEPVPAAAEPAGNPPKGKAQ